MNKALTYTTIASALYLMTGCAGEIPKNLGAHDGRLAACPASPNCVSSQADDKEHQIAPLAVTGNPEAALGRLQQQLSKREDTKIVGGKDGYLRVEFHTRLFVDDGEFLLDPAHSAIQVRSASRLGHSDLGKNRSRMEEIRQAFLKG
jgi:uncharacterized protein (DUF1499 family)